MYMVFMLCMSVSNLCDPYLIAYGVEYPYVVMRLHVHFTEAVARILK